MKVDIRLLDIGKSMACYNGFEILSDLPTEKKGTGHFPEPFDYFIFSVGLCAGHFVKQFCVARNIEYQNITLSTSFVKAQNGRPVIETTIQLSPDFPPKYRDAILVAISSCSVKKTIEQNPEFLVKIDNVSK